MNPKSVKTKVSDQKKQAGKLAKPSNSKGTKLPRVSKTSVVSREQPEHTKKELRLFRALIDQSNDAIEVLDPETGRFLDVNEKACQDLGYTREEHLSLSVFDIGLTVTHAKYKNAIEELRKSNIPMIAGIHRRKDGSTFPVEVSLKYARLDRDYVISVARDITGRKQADEKLQESERRFRDLVETTSDWIWEINEQGVYTYASPRIREILGYEAGEIIGKSPFDLMPDDEAEKIAALFSKIFAKHSQFSNIENKNLHKDGYIVVLETSGNPVFDKDGVFRGYRGIDRDISERKQAEKEREQYFRFFKTSSDLMAIADPNGAFMKTNPACSQVLGYSEAELVAKPFMGFVHPDDKQSTLDEMARQQQIGSSLNFENRYVCKDGSVRWLSWRAIYNKEEGITYATARDITERKQAEEALRESESFRKLIYDAEPECVKVVSLNGKLLDMNRAGLDMIEADTLEQVQGQAILDLIVPEYQNMVSDLHKRVINGESGTLEFEIIGLKGTRRWLETHAVPLRNNNGEIISLLGLTRDITERKQAEEKLKDSEARLSGILAHAAEAVIVINEKEQIETFNTSAQKVFGYTADEIIGKPLGLLMPDEFVQAHHQHLKNFAESAHESRHMRERGEIMCQRKDGTKFISEIAISKHIQNDHIFFTAIIMDITERKRAEEHLRYQADLLENVSDAIVSTDIQFKVVSINKAAQKTYGWKEEEVIGMDWGELTDAQFTGETRAEVRAELAAHGEWTGEVSQRCRDGRRVIVDRKVSYIYDKENKPLGVVSINRDITERKQAEEAIKFSEEKFARAFHSSPNLMAITTPEEGRIVEINDAYCQVLGYEREECVGHTTAELRIWADSEQRKRVVQKIKEEGHAHNVEADLRRKSGEISSVVLSMEPVTIDDKEYFLSVAMNITERKKAEEKILRLNRLYATLSQINQSIVRTHEANSLFNEICRIAVEHGQFRMAWIGLIDEADGLVKPVNFYGEEQGYLTDVKIKYLDEALGRGPTGTAIREGRCVICQDVANDPLMEPWREPALQRGYRSSASVPISRFGRVIGALTVYASESHGFDIDEQNLLEEIGSDISFALDFMDTETARARAEGHTVEQLQRLKAMHTVDRAIASNFDLHVTLNTVLDQLKNQLQVDAASICMFDKYMLTLEHLANIGFYSGTLRGDKSKVAESLGGRAILERHAIHIPDLSKTNIDPASAFRYQSEKFVSYHALPLISKGQVKGVIEVFHRKRFEPDAEWLDFLEALAEQAAIAIDISKLFNDLQRSNIELTLAYDATIEGWSHALDLRDKETEGHTLRVTDITMQLADKLGIAKEDQIKIRRGALLHDIGKLGVPDGILLKPGSLTDEEMAIMRQHPIHAYQMLKPIDYLQSSTDIPYCHHEKWDGTGYPRRLKGEQIPINARIFAVVDVWDALCSDRPYRSAWTKEKALEYIREQSGKHFDPHIVEIFLNMIADQ